MNIGQKQNGSPFFLPDTDQGQHVFIDGGTGTGTPNDGAGANPARHLSHAVPAKRPALSRTVVCSSLGAIAAAVLLAVMMNRPDTNPHPGPKTDNQDALAAQTTYFKELQNAGT